MILSLKSLRYMIVFWILAAGMLVSDTAVYLYYLRPAENLLARIESEYQMKRADRKPEIEGPDKKARELKAVYRELPRWEDFTRVMGEVYNKAERLNLKIESASYQPSPVKDSGLVQVTVTMPVTGSYADIKRFVYDLETSPRLFIIENLSLGSGKGQEGDISLKLTVAAHFKG
ncbi:MAG: hypothetical protein HW415_446 [Deltaproteobacteria bacterium]|nr:hypothetical protein [Deltaproteobacteria bacterium]